MKKNELRFWKDFFLEAIPATVFVLMVSLFLSDAKSDDTGFPTADSLRKCSRLNQVTLQSRKVLAKHDPKARLLYFSEFNGGRPFVLTQGELWAIPENADMPLELLFTELPTEFLGAQAGDDSTIKIVSQESRGFRITHLDPVLKKILSSTPYFLDSCPTCSESVREPAMSFHRASRITAAGRIEPVWFLVGRTHVWSFDPKTGTGPVLEFSLTPKMLDAGEEIVGFSGRLGYEYDGPKLIEVRAITTAIKGRSQYRLNEFQTRIAYYDKSTLAFTGFSEPAQGWAIVGGQAFSNGLLAKREPLSDPPDLQINEDQPTLRSQARLVEGRCGKEGEKWFLDPKISYERSLFFPFSFLPRLISRQKIYLNSELGQKVFDLAFASSAQSGSSPNAVLVVQVENEESQTSRACSLGRGVISIERPWWPMHSVFLLQSSEKEGLYLRRIRFGQ